MANKIEVPRRVSYDLRQQFGVSAQMATRTIATYFAHPSAVYILGKAATHYQPGQATGATRDLLAPAAFWKPERLAVHLQGSAVYADRLASISNRFGDALHFGAGSHTVAWLDINV